MSQGILELAEVSGLIEVRYFWKALEHQLVHHNLMVLRNQVDQVSELRLPEVESLNFNTELFLVLPDEILLELKFTDFFHLQVKQISLCCQFIVYDLSP